MAACKIAVRAKFDLALVVPVDDEGSETGVDGEIDEEEEREAFDSLTASLSDKLFLLRVELDCETEEESVSGSVECSESDRERDCFSILVFVCFLVEERSSVEIESVDTNGESVDNEDR